MRGDDYGDSQGKNDDHNWCCQGNRQGHCTAYRTGHTHQQRWIQLAKGACVGGGTDTPFRKADRPDYLRPESVAEAVYAALTLPEDLVVHHFTFRPMVETNF